MREYLVIQDDRFHGAKQGPGSLRSDFVRDISVLNRGQADLITKIAEDTELAVDFGSNHSEYQYENPSPLRREGTSLGCANRRR